MRKLPIVLFAFLLLTGGGLFAYGLDEARRDPLVRRATVSLPNWPAGARSVRAVLMSDIHIGSWTMDAERLNRIVDQVAALEPDIVFIAGDFINGSRAGSATTIGPALVAPLARLKPPLGIVAVLGNHDNWTGAGAVRDQLRRAGVTVLENETLIRGPLAIGGVGDQFSHHAQVSAVVAPLRQAPGAQLFLTHSPGIAPFLPDGSVLLAGHTHCGQARLFGRYPGRQPYETRYRCGIVREGGRMVIVTAGLGTSSVPVRIGVPPDIWLLTLGR